MSTLKETNLKREKKIFSRHTKKATNAAKTLQIKKLQEKIIASYSRTKSKTVISLRVPSRIGGPQVPVPCET